jgi:hypothetical protein
MTEINPKLISELQESARKGGEAGAGFVLPWRINTDNDKPIWQQDVHACSCGCGCPKSKALKAKAKAKKGKAKKAKKAKKARKKK